MAHQNPTRPPPFGPIRRKRIIRSGSSLPRPVNSVNSQSAPTPPPAEPATCRFDRQPTPRQSTTSTQQATQAASSPPYTNKSPVREDTDLAEESQVETQIDVVTYEVEDDWTLVDEYSFVHHTTSARRRKSTTSQHHPTPQATTET